MRNISSIRIEQVEENRMVNQIIRLVIINRPWWSAKVEAVSFCYPLDLGVGSNQANKFGMEVSDIFLDCINRVTLGITGDKDWDDGLLAVAFLFA